MNKTPTGNVIFTLHPDIEKIINEISYSFLGEMISSRTMSDINSTIRHRISTELIRNNFDFTKIFTCEMEMYDE